jgi:hypothetical protein
VTLPLLEEEAAVLADMRRVGGFRSDEDTVKGALWWYARFLDLDIHPDVFALSLPERHARMLVPDGDQGELFVPEVGA